MNRTQKSIHWSSLFGKITKIIQYMYLTLLVVVILTAIALVAVALGIANAISPRSFNPQKGEAYECGIPTRGKSWMQFKVGYYLFAILFLSLELPLPMGRGRRFQRRTSGTKWQRGNNLL